MKYVFLVSHGELARGMHTALKMLSGENRDDILSVGLEDGMGADVFVENVKKTLSVVGEDDEILLFADLVGGSPLTNAANTIAELVPQASVGFAHGQMKERELESVMFDFINGDLDVLVTLTREF